MYMYNIHVLVTYTVHVHTFIMLLSFPHINKLPFHKGLSLDFPQAAYSLVAQLPICPAL